jgi:probable rRNA maturation factor
MNIYLGEDQNLEAPLMEKLKEAAEYLLTKEGVENQDIEISLTMVSPEEIKELNRDYRGVDKVTDVLSFPQFEEDEEIPSVDVPFGEISLGDVVICVEKAQEQADEYGHSFEREFVYLFVHSLLHLLGYDHMEDDEKVIMRLKEEDVMEHLHLRRESYV